MPKVRSGAVNYVPVKTYEECTDLQQKFIDAWIKYDGNEVIAAKEAGLAPKNLEARARELAVFLGPVIQGEMERKIRGHAPMALNAVVKLAQEGKTETTRLKAALEILDRAGFKQATHVIHEDRTPDKMGDAELKSMLKRLLTKAGVSAEVIEMTAVSEDEPGQD